MMILYMHSAAANVRLPTAATASLEVERYNVAGKKLDRKRNRVSEHGGNKQMWQLNWNQSLLSPSCECMVYDSSSCQNAEGDVPP